MKLSNKTYLRSNWRISFLQNQGFGFQTFDLILKYILYTYNKRTRLLPMLFVHYNYVIIWNVSSNSALPPDLTTVSITDFNILQTFCWEEAAFEFF